jgi:cation diffusion facilitator family transporter
MGITAERRGRQHQSLALIASGEHLKSDAYSTVGLVLGLGLIYFTGWAWLDSLIALIFGFIIGITGYRVVRSSISGIMDEVDYSLVKDLVQLLQAQRHEHWIDVHNFRVIKYGDSLHIDCHLTVPRFFNVVEAHAEVDRLEELLQKEIGESTELFIHVDPCIPECCKLCALEHCPIRTQAFEQLEVWTEENIMRNRKHGLSDSEGRLA